jgi:aspartate/methionine/tyrosine aminotransferase
VTKPLASTAASVDRIRPVHYPPWCYMLAVDDVNYNLTELVAYADRRPESPLVNLASGVNFIDAPRGLIAAALRYAAHPLFWHDYDGPFGHLVGRAAVAAYENDRSGGQLRLDVNHVIVTAGASAALGLVSPALHDRYVTRGHQPRATIPVPTFPLVGACLARAGFAIDEVVSTVPGRWLPTVDELIAGSRPETGVVYLNTYNNPSGEHYGEQELRRLVEWAGKRQVTVLHDTVSSAVAAAGRLPHLLSIAHAAGNRDLVTVGSMSKARAVPGFRAGWLIAAPNLVSGLARDNEMDAPSSPAVASPALALDRLATGLADAVDDGTSVDPQAALTRCWANFYELAAPYLPAAPGLKMLLEEIHRELEHGQTIREVLAWRASLRDTLATNAQMLVEEFDDVVAEVPAWQGDFNTFVRLPALDGRPYLATTHQLFRDHGLQTLPAPAFGRHEAWWSSRGYYTRLSFALPTGVWEDGLTRLRYACECAGRHRAARPKG